MLSEAEFLRKVRQFDAEALGELYDQLSPMLFRYALRLLDDTALAEDCVTETFSRLLAAFKANKGPDQHLKAYLYRIAHNWCTDRLRAAQHGALSLDALEEDSGFELEAGADAAPALVLDGKLAAAQVRQALLALTPDQRLAITLRFYEDLPNEDIAAALNRPVGAIKALHFRAMAALRKQLAGAQLTSTPGELHT